mmetsp:Transcript_10122/g.11588  ORF Transcript_10122/g.11588 Transcript_10122/m.11588 type:complete len:84 (-) Transcript_10122:316-567(-)
MGHPTDITPYPASRGINHGATLSNPTLVVTMLVLVAPNQPPAYHAAGTVTVEALATVVELTAMLAIVTLLALLKVVECRNIAV